MAELIGRFVKDQSGETAVEYGLIAAGLSVAIVTVLQGIGSRLVTTFDAVQAAMQ